MKCCKNWGKSRPRRELNRCACCFFRGAATQRVSIVVIARQWFSCYSWHLHLCMSLLYTGKSPAWLSSLLLASIRGPWKYRKEDHLSPKACLHLTSLNLYSKYWSTENHPLISNCFKNLLSWIRHRFMLVAIFNTVCTRTKHWFELDQRSTNTYRPYKMISPNCSALCSSIPVCVDIRMHTYIPAGQKRASDFSDFWQLLNYVELIPFWGIQVVQVLTLTISYHLLPMVATWPQEGTQ